MSAPDVKTVAITRADGGLTILRVIETEYLLDGSIHARYDVTPEYIETVIAKYGWTGPLAPVSWRLVPNDFGSNEDREFRNAWKDNGKARPEHDMEKAKEIHRNKLRKVRGNLLDALDSEYLIADESGDQQAKRDVVLRKKKLRDAPADPRIAEAKTVEELKALTLEVLVK